MTHAIVFHCKPCGSRAVVRLREPACRKGQGKGLHSQCQFAAAPKVPPEGCELPRTSDEAKAGRRRKALAAKGDSRGLPLVAGHFPCDF